MYICICACRLAKQVSVYYEEVHRLLMVQPLASHFDKSWTAHVAVKLSLYDLEAQMQSAEALHADDDIAPEIARLRVSEDLLDGGGMLLPLPRLGCSVKLYLVALLS